MSGEQENGQGTYERPIDTEIAKGMEIGRVIASHLYEGPQKPLSGQPPSQELSPAQRYIRQFAQTLREVTEGEGSAWIGLLEANAEAYAVAEGVSVKPGSRERYPKTRTVRIGSIDLDKGLFAVYANLSGVGEASDTVVLLHRSPQDKHLGTVEVFQTGRGYDSLPFVLTPKPMDTLLTTLRNEGVLAQNEGLTQLIGKIMPS